MAATNITNLTKSDLVTLLKRAGSRHATIENLDKDIAAGAPINPDGTINLIHFTAWMIKPETRHGN